MNGPPINVITAHDDRDPIAGTPHHKNVAVRLAPVQGVEAEDAEAMSQRVRVVAASSAATPRPPGSDLAHEPAEMPVERPAVFELVINLKTWKRAAVHVDKILKGAKRRGRAALDAFVQEHRRGAELGVRSNVSQA